MFYPSAAKGCYKFRFCHKLDKKCLHNIIAFQELGVYRLKINIALLQKWVKVVDIAGSV